MLWWKRAGSHGGGVPGPPHLLPPHLHRPLGCGALPRRGVVCNLMSLLQDPPPPRQPWAVAPPGGGSRGGSGRVSGSFPTWGFLSCSRPRGSWTWKAPNFARPRGRAGRWRRSPAPGVSGAGRDVCVCGEAGGGGQTPFLSPLNAAAMSPLAPPEVAPAPQPLLASARQLLELVELTAPAENSWGGEGGVFLGYFPTRLGIVQCLMSPAGPALCHHHPMAQAKEKVGRSLVSGPMSPPSCVPH